MAYNQAKTQHAFQVFHRNLRDDDFMPVLFMYGDEEYLTEWAAKSLADKFVDKTLQDIDFVKLPGEESDADRLLGACDTLSVFSPRRIIWAKDFPPLIKKNSKGFGESEVDKIIDYVNNPNPDAILIFSCVKPDETSKLVKTLKKQCRCYNFDSLDMPQLMAFAEKRFKAAGVNISRSDLKYFVDETGYFHRDSDYKLYNLQNDIIKLIAHSGALNITKDDIDQTLQGDMDSFVFNFLDAISNNQKDKALRMLYNILGTSGEIFSILGLLVNQFELILEVKELKEEGMSQEQIAKELKVNAYRVKKTMPIADRFSYKKLKETLIQLYETDRNIKTGMMDQNLSLELLIGRI